MQTANILVIAGMKINSFSLCIEAASFYSQTNKVYILDLDFLPRFLVPSKRKLLNRVRRIGADISITKLKNLEMLTSSLRLIRDIRRLYKELLNYDEWALNKKDPELETLHRLIRSLQARIIGTANFSLKDANPRHTKRLIIQVCINRHKIENFAKRMKVSKIVTHGGRDVYSAAAIMAARKNGIPFRLLEMGGVTGRWKEFITSPHWCPEWWEMLDQVDICAIEKDAVNDWWKSRLEGVDWMYDRNWGETRKKGLLPQRLPDRFVVFYSTSEFELPAFSFLDQNFGEFRSQMDGVAALLRVCQEKGISLVIRRHPNSVGVRGVDMEENQWKEVSRHPLVTYISPKQEIDSISLLKRAEIVFTYRSSIGIEAMYLGKPSFALGAPRWARDSSCRAWSLDDIRGVFNGDPKWRQAIPDLPVRWATIMLQMGEKNNIFREIHGNWSVVGEGEQRIAYSRVARIFAMLIESIVDLILFKVPECKR